ncbi:MAG: hypothetical protein M3P08_06830 [Thermoproteota archaeon]|nr:hypothetical protein [Thermoproteota archaeon]
MICRCFIRDNYILYVISMLGYEIYEIYTIKGEKKINEPLAKAEIKIGKTTLNSNIADQTLISRRLYNLADEGLIIETDKRKFKMQFD